MAKKKEDDIFEVVDGEVKKVTKRPQLPASDPHSREGQLINLAVDLAEKQLIEGTASAQVIVHYLKLATKEEQLKRRILGEQARLIEAKVESLESAKSTEAAYKEAIEAMKRYGGSGG